MQTQNFRNRYRCYVSHAPVIVAALLLLTGSLHAGTVLDAASATTTLHGGDRELNTLSFTGSPTVMTGADFLRFDDGYLYEPAHTKNVAPDSPTHLYAWNDYQHRDTGTGGNYEVFSPDRTDAATPYLNEGSDGGSLVETFGPFTSGQNTFKNMSYLQDGEAVNDGGNVNEPYYVDLLFADGFTLSGDGDDTTVEIALLERGGNSKMRVYGILQRNTLPESGYDNASQAAIDSYNPILTQDSLLADDNTGTFNSLWTMDTLEISSAQGVRGYGLSIDWDDLVGIRVMADTGYSFDGPDLVAVGAVPEPASMSLLAVGGLALLRRRRRR